MLVALSLSCGFLGLADDERFDEAHTSELRGDNAVAAVFDVVAAADARAQNAAEHLASIFEVDAHLLDLTAIAIEELLHGRLGDEDLVEVDVDGAGTAVVVVAIFVVLGTVGLAHDASFGRRHRRNFVNGLFAHRFRNARHKTASTDEKHLLGAHKSCAKNISARRRLYLASFMESSFRVAIILLPSVKGLGQPAAITAP